MTKVYISNIKSDIHKDDGCLLIAELGIHELICDRRIETSNKVKKNVVSILDAIEYASVLKHGYYVVYD
ncbi:hypothetical protein [Lachnospira multipara]|uniref:hypothetical protein n=1 Tax=Lachnospira multipara TaxID=28051 RepID=UPI000486FDF7|nr:hypothetical protein [Lachnospira multipara]